MTRFRAFVFVALFAAVPVFAATTDLTVLMDTDRDATTGCTVAGMTGIEQVLVTRVVSDATTAAVTRTFRQICSGGSLGGETDVVATGWPAGFQPASGRMLIESRIPFSAFGTEVPRIHLGVNATQGSLTHTAMGLTDGSAVYYPEMPRGKRRASSAPGNARTITLDGNDGDWGGLDPLFNGIAGGGVNGLRIIKINAFANSADDFLYFLFEINVSSDAPIAVDDAYERPAGAGLTIPAPGVLDNDEDPAGQPLTALPVSPAAHGNVTLNPDGGFTYTPNDPASTQTDQFEYKASNGTKESAAAKVTISVDDGGFGNNQAPVFATPATRSVPEGTTAVGSVTAIDPDGDTVTYSITGGADASKFTLQGGNELAFNSAPDFEAPLSAGGSNSYVVEVTADDANGGTTTQTITVNVTNVDEAPSITSSNAFSVDENTTAVGTITASDPDGTPITYSLGGTDAARFTINPSTGALSFTTAPDYENPTDAGSNNVYAIQITATDGTGSAAVQNVNVTVEDVNEAPVFTSTASPAIPENTTAVVTVTVDDPENNAIVYSISGGTDAGDFTINPATGALSFTVAPNFEAPADADANNVYVVQISATDGTNPVTQSMIVTVTNVNESPSITSSGVASVPENTTAVLTVTTTDPENNTITYSITGGADAGDFAINASTGALTFNPAPNFEAPADADANNVYLVQVNANDGANNVSQTITVTVTNVNEAPAFTSTATPSVPENTTAVVTVTTTDQEGQAVTYSLSGGADQAKFAINAVTGALTFLVAPNFEAPTDSDANNTYVVQVTATDGTNPVNQVLTVTVTNVNEAPVITSPSTASVAENTIVATTVTTTDQEGNTITYSITGGADAGDFTINATTGALSFNPAPNFEAPADADTNNQYLVQVTATDGTTPVNQTITITVTNVNEAPLFTSGATPTVVEGNTAVTTVTTTDEDGNTVTYSITGGADMALFSINTSTGALTFNSAPNFEAPADADANNTYLVEVTANDGTNNAMQALTVTVTDANEAPVANDATFNVDENSANGTAVGTVVATDQDASQTLTYAITGGNALGAFTINSSTGAITVADVTDVNFEVNPSFTLTVTVTDDGTGTLSDTASITINVNNLNEAPVVDAATTAVNENTANGTTVHTVTFTEPDNTGQTHTFSITGGNAAGAFTINSSTGAITVANSSLLDYETTTSYSLTVEVTDAGAPTPALAGTATITINVNDVNEAPAFTSSAAPSVAENTTAVVTVTTTDPENNTVTYSITGGADMALFTIDTNTGALSFLVAPNFEAPADAGANNVYDVVVTATDGTNSPTQAIAVTVLDGNEAPSFTSSATPSVAENTVLATTVTTSDPEGNTVTYSITGGADAADFTIDTNTGALSFNSAPNFEAPADADTNNTYLVEVTATDGTNPVQQSITVTVTNADEAPAFTSSSTPTVAENTILVLSVQASDQEGQTLSYSITGGADAADFSINAVSGDLTFNVTPNFEAPHDADTNNVYLVQVTATDGTNPVIQNLTITITNANEAPSITSGNFSVPENTTTVGNVTATDPDGDTPTYAIVGSTDSSYFAIDSNTGALSFLAPPNFESPQDSGANNVYDITVRASDGGALFQDLAITITVTAVNEAPVFTSAAGPAVAENTTAVVDVDATDPEGAGVTYSITGGADQAKFTIDTNTGVLAFLVAPDFELPTDADANNTYLVQVTATDGSVPAAQNLVVTVVDANDPPSFTSSATPSVAENTTTAVDVDATDPEAGTVTYSITGGADAADFSIDSNTGVLSFLVQPNFEAPHDADTNNVYLVQVTATDGTNPAVQNLTITVTNANEAPSITSSNATTVAENSVTVLTVTTTDPEGQTVTYSITGGADAASFSIDTNTGALSFVAPPNFEAPTDADANNVYLVQVTATDGTNPVNQTITVTVSNVNEAPFFTSSATPSRMENVPTTHDVDATDPEGAAVTYSIVGGADAADFSIDGSTGVLSFLVNPNFEAPHDADTNNVYLVDVQATDGTNNLTQNISWTVTNVNEIPLITSPNSNSVPENQTNAHTIVGSDPDAGTTLTYSITGGEDQAKFSVNSSTGVLTFLVAPDFENPTDSDLNNAYRVEVTVSDGVNSSGNTQTITVTNVDEGPTFTSANSASVAENTVLALDVNATDPEGSAVTFSITGGADSGDFTINATTGELSFNPAPNFELPADADTNNIYVVQVTATDGVNPVNQTVTITVTNVNEAPVNTVPGATQTTQEDTNLVFPGTISVSDPDGAVTVQVTLTATHGTLSTNGITGLTFTTGDGTDDPTLVFTGTTTNINARLNGLTYKPDLNYYGTGGAAGTISMTTDDQGNTGSGGALQDGPDVVTININPVNDKPTTASYTVANGNAHITQSGIGITISAADSNELKEDAADVDDHDPYSELTVQIVGGTLSPANATLTLIDASTGAFYFEPPGGLSGSAAASFQYQVCDNGDVGLGLAAQCSDPATVQFTITGTDTWFVDDTDAAGCGVTCNGARTKPLVGLNNAALATRGTGDRIFAFSGTYNHGFTMAASERLIGQAATGTFDTHFGVVVPSNGTLDSRPSMSGAAVTLQNTLTAANNTLLRGFTITAGANKGYVSASGNTTLTVLESTVASTGNMAIDVTGATNAATSVSFSTTNSSGGTRGVSLDGVNGTWALGSGALNNNTQAAFYLQNSNASTITYAGNLAPTGTGRAVLIGTADGNSGANASNGMEAGTIVTLSGNITAGGVAVYESSGGTLNLTGTTHTFNTAAVRGVDLIDNNGATFNFSSGNLTITTTTATGFHASQGGTVNVTGAANTISTTSGNAFEAIGTASEHMGGGYAFRSISSTNGTKGISVQYHDGAFGVSGDGVDGDTNPDSVTAGGTITGSDQRGAEFVDVNGPITLHGMTFTNPADTANPADASTAAGTCGNIPSGGSNTGCYAGIHLDTVATVSINTVNVSGSGQIGINGNAITGLTMNTVTVSNTGSTSGEDGIRLYNLNGSGSITSLTVTNSFGKGLLIENTNVSLGTAGSPYLVTGSNFQNSSNAQGVNLNTDISGTMHVKFVNGTISGNFSNGIQTAGLGSGTLGIYIDNTSFSNNTSAVVVQSSGGTTNFDIRNIDHVGRTTNASCGLCIKSDGPGVATGVIESNLIGNGTVGSGASCGGGCNGINIDARNTSSMTVAVRGNTIRNVDQNGIGIRGGEGTSKLNVTLTGNLIKDPDNAASTLAAIFADSGVLSSDGNCVTVTIGGNTAWPGSPTTSTSDVQNRIEGAWGVSGVRVRKLFGGGAPPEPVFNLPGYDGSGVNTWIQNDNSFSGVATTVTSNTGSGGAFTGGASCP
jgi:VCBS repeat-containing protein